MPAGYRGGFNPYRDRHGRWATADAAPAPAPATSGGGGAEINAAIRVAAGRSIEPAGPRSYHGYAPALATALRDFEDRTRHNPSEGAAIIGADGVVLAEKSGTKNRVHLGAAEKAKMRGAIVTHNHPTYPGSGDTSFSGADISMAIQHGASEIRAVVGRFNHVAQLRTPGTQEASTVGKEALFDLMYDEAELGQRLGRASKGTSPAAMAHREQLIHEMNLGWAKQFGYVYYRENLETGEVEGYGHDD